MDSSQTEDHKDPERNIELLKVNNDRSKTMKIGEVSRMEEELKELNVASKVGYMTDYVYFPHE